MNIVAIAGSTIPSDTANSLQVMKACQALVQIGHTVTLLVPAATSAENKSVDLQIFRGYLFLDERIRTKNPLKISYFKGFDFACRSRARPRCSAS